MNRDIRVLLADDDPVLRENLPPLLDAQDGIRVVGIAENGAEAMVLIGAHHPHVALLDIDMPVLDGIETAKEMKRLFPSVNVVILTAFEREDTLASALAAGARGFLTKDSSPDELADYIRRAAEGKQVMAPHPFELLTANYLATMESKEEYEPFRQAVTSLPEHLKPVLQGLMQAKSNREIARITGLTESTVRSYTTDILSHTKCRTRGQLAITAIKANIKISEPTYSEGSQQVGDSA